MKARKAKTWQHEITGPDGNVMLFGVNIFEYEWKETGKSVRVRHPLYSQEYKFRFHMIWIDAQLSACRTGEIGS